LVWNDYAVAAAVRFLRQPAKPNTPRALANNGSSAGSGTRVIVFDTWRRVSSEIHRDATKENTALLK
jgi:hypothetical protein